MRKLTVYRKCTQIDYIEIEVPDGMDDSSALEWWLKQDCTTREVDEWEEMGHDEVDFGTDLKELLD